jgi:hypothetical protein
LPPRLLAKSALAICLTVACGGAVTLLPRSAEAKPPAAKSAKQPIGVGAITGPQSSKVRAKVMKVLRDSGTYEVTDVEDIKPGSPPQKYQTMATGIQADAIVVGTVSKKMALTLSIYAANGARIDAVTIKGGSGPGLLKEVENELEIAVADPLSKARPSSAPSAAPAAAPAAAAAAGPATAPVKVTLDEDDGAGAHPAGKAEPPAKSKAKPKDEDVESEDVASTPEDEAQPESASSNDSSSESSEASEKGQRPIEVMIGIRGYNRQFKYTGITSGPLVPYELGLAPTVFIAARLYPAAFSSDGVLSNIGLMGRFELGIATSTNYQATPGAEPTKLSTNAYEYQLGVRGRLPLGRFELGIFALYGNQSFSLGGDENPAGAAYALVPDAHYHYIRTGLDLRAYISKLIVEAHVAPRFLTSMSEIDLARVWFPGAVGSGLDGGLMLGWQFLPWLTAAVGGDFVRYGFDFNNLPATPPPRVIAGGATDTYLSGWLGVMSTFDFSGHAAGGAASVSTTASESSESSESSDTAPEAEEEKPKAAPPPKAKKEAAPKPTAPKHAAAKPAAKPAKQTGPKKKTSAPVPEEEEEEE